MITGNDMGTINSLNQLGKQGGGSSGSLFGKGQPQQKPKEAETTLSPFAPTTEAGATDLVDKPTAKSPLDKLNMITNMYRGIA